MLPWHPARVDLPAVERVGGADLAEPRVLPADVVTDPAAEQDQPVYVPERGYWLGPTLPVGERAWPLFWEQQDGLDDCLHEWERVMVQRHGVSPEPVVRCRRCSAPRCGDSTDRDPCMERRHHGTTHLTLHGSFEPVGGYLTEEADRG